MKYLGQKNMRQLMLAPLGICLLGGCAAPHLDISRNPAREFADRVRAGSASADIGRQSGFVSPAQRVGPADGASGRASLRLVNEGGRQPNEFVSNAASDGDGYSVRESTLRHRREYQGPLALGDPGVAASLWQESRGGNNLFYDYRAWQPMDLLTVVVSESAEGKKEADTEVKQETDIKIAIEKLLGLENNSAHLDPTALINASTTNDFKGEGATNRKDSLKARISAIVIEVLPSGILRVEGEKIISVNNEEQVMIVSGLVRPRDVNSENEVDSSKVANMRIDYYGRGTIGEAQYGGWLGRFVRKVWPF